MRDETRQPLTVGDLPLIVGDLSKSTGVYVREAIGAVTAPLERRIAELTERVQALEGATKWYAGVWKNDVRYRAGQSTSYHNGLWVATTDTGGTRPGTTSDWVLAVRPASRNGKDADVER